MQYITRKQAIDLTGLSERTLFRKASDGEIRTQKIGIVKYCLDDLLNSLDASQLINCVSPDLRQFIREVNLKGEEPFGEVVTEFVKLDQLDFLNRLIFQWRANPQNDNPVEFVRFLQSLL